MKLRSEKLAIIQRNLIEEEEPDVGQSNTEEWQIKWFYIWFSNSSQVSHRILSHSYAILIAKQVRCSHIESTYFRCPLILLDQ